MSTLKVKLDGEVREAQPLDVVGLLLICAIPGHTGTAVVAEFNALDKLKFWRTWEALGGERQGVLIGDEDGTNCRPFRVPAEYRDKPSASIQTPARNSWFRRLIGFLFPWEDLPT